MECSKTSVKTHSTRKEQSHLGKNVIVTFHLFSITIASFSPPKVLAS